MKAIYAGSFDPFTYGHLDVIKAASQIFDHVVVACAINSKKKSRFDREKMRCAIEDCLHRNGIANTTVIISNNLISEVAANYKAEFLVRGLRNTMDFMYEEEIAKLNHRINPSLRTIYIRAIDETLSSSAVKELLDYGEDVSEFVPDEVLEIIENVCNHIC